MHGRTIQKVVGTEATTETAPLLLQQQLNGGQPPSTVSAQTMVPKFGAMHVKAAVCFFK